MLLSKTHYVQEGPSHPLFMDTVDDFAKNMEETRSTPYSANTSMPF